MASLPYARSYSTSKPWDFSVYLSTESFEPASSYCTTNSFIQYFLQPCPRLLNWTAGVQKEKETESRSIINFCPRPPFSKIQGTDTVKTSSPVYRLPQHLRFWKAETRKISVTLVCLNTKQIQNLFTFQRKILVTPKHPEPPNTFTIASVRNNHQIKNKPAHPKHTHIFFSIKHFPGRVLKFLNANC